MWYEMPETDRDWTTVSIPSDLAEKIDKIAKEKGYQNRADFVRDAIRRLLEDLDKKEA